MRKIHRVTNGVVYFIFSTLYVLAALVLSLLILSGFNSNIFIKVISFIIIMSGGISALTEVIRIKCAE